MGDLISREAAVQMLREKAHGNYPSMFVVTENDLEIVRTAITECANEVLQMPAVDAVPRDEYEALLRRFRHLLQSDFIHSFDEVDPLTGVYKRNIAEADKAEPVRHGRWITESIPQDGYRTYCSNCKRLLHNAPFIPYDFCPHCNAKMDGGKEE